MCFKTPKVEPADPPAAPPAPPAPAPIAPVINKPLDNPNIGTKSSNNRTKQKGKSSLVIPLRPRQSRRSGKSSLIVPLISSSGTGMNVPI